MKEQDARRRLEELRREFEGTAEEMRGRLASSQLESGGEISTGVDQHPADAATETADRELDVSREAMFEARLAQIDEALDRLEAGTYGICVACGRRIPHERLEVVPDTPFCVEDASREQSRATTRAQ